MSRVKFVDSALCVVHEIWNSVSGHSLKSTEWMKRLTVYSMHKKGRVHQIFIIFRVIYWHTIYMRPTESSSNKTNNEFLDKWLPFQFIMTIKWIIFWNDKLNWTISHQLKLYSKFESKAPERHQKSTIELKHTHLFES